MLYPFIQYIGFQQIINMANIQAALSFVPNVEVSNSIKQLDIEMLSFRLISTIYTYDDIINSRQNGGTLFFNSLSQVIDTMDRATIEYLLSGFECLNEMFKLAGNRIPSAVINYVKCLSDQSLISNIDKCVLEYDFMVIVCGFTKYQNNTLFHKAIKSCMNNMDRPTLENILMSFILLTIQLRMFN